MNKTAIRPFHVNVPEAELTELRRRINATNSAVVGLSDGVTIEGFVTGIFVSICRYSILILVSLVLLGSAVTSTAQTLHRNGKIAFTSDRDGNFEIYTINPDGSDEVRLTNSAEVESYPTWSPDGRMIAFISQAPAGGRAIFRMNEDGTNKIRITPIRSSSAPLSWSPDGGRIAFHDTDPQLPGSYIFVVNIDGSNRRNLTAGNPDNLSSDIDPSWSPDGSRILFSRLVPRAIGPVLHTINPDGTQLRALPDGFMDGNGDTMPSWSPMGDKIIFIVNVFDFVNDIFIANADGTERRFFHGCISSDTSCRLDALNPKFSPDGTKIVFSMTDFFRRTFQMFVKNIDGTGLKLLADSAQTPSWQPRTKSNADFDGDRKSDIGFYRTGNWFIIRSSNGAVVNVGWGGPSWSPIWGDFDGDERADIAVYNPIGVWSIVRSSDGGNSVLGWGGGPTDIPVPEDYDGDGKSDVAIYRDGAWSIIRSSDGRTTSVGWGGSSWIPVPADYDGDGKADIAVYNSGAWSIIRSSDAVVIHGGWGGPSWTPVVADYDGDGKADIAVYNTVGTFAMIRSSDGANVVVGWGGPDWLPVPADYDGDGKADIAVFNLNGEWSILRSSDGGNTRVVWGEAAGAVPLSGKQ